MTVSASGRRSVRAKSNMILNNLSCPQEERMLRTAYCKNNNQLENIDNMAMLSKTNRNQQASSTAYDYMPPIARGGSQLGKTEASPDHTTVEKSGRAKQHWDLVCTRKYQVIMNKQ